jgi:hypothetical protein
MFVRALLLAVCVLVLSAAPAAAHTRLIGSNPAEGAALATAPTRVELTFSEPVGPGPLTVRGADGTAWTVSAPTGSGAVVAADVVPAGPAGVYTLDYEVTATDGHALRGTVTFSLTTAVPAPTTTTTTTTTPPTTKGTPTGAPITDAVPVVEDQGLPQWAWWLIIVGGVVIVAAIAGGFVRARRR